VENIAKLPEHILLRCGDDGHIALSALRLVCCNQNGGAPNGGGAIFNLCRPAESLERRRLMRAKAEQT
jgi:hypothetical protein